MWRWVLLGTGLAIALLGLAFYFLRVSPLSFVAAAGDGGSILQRCAASPQKQECYTNALKELVAAQTPIAALDALQLIVSRDGVAAGMAHPLTHAVGHATYAKYQDLSEALANCRDDFTSGCYHGVMEMRIGRGGEPSRQEIAEACSDPRIRTTQFLNFQCVHGLGHGLMMNRLVRSAEPGINDVKFALSECDYLADGWSRESCYGGVFMEHVVAATTPPLHYPKQPSFRPDDLNYPCDEVDERYQRECYVMQASVMLNLTGRDYTKSFAACAAVPNAGLAFACYSSLGREASGEAIGADDRIWRTCQLGATEAAIDGCVWGAAKNETYTNAKPAEGIGFCQKVDARYQGSCVQAVGEMIYSLYATPDERKQACSSLEPELRSRCETGARVGG